MRKICVQAGHLNTNNGQTGAPRELERTKAISLRLVELLKSIGVDALQDDALPEDDTRVTTTDWDLYIALHCDANYAGDEGGGFVDFPDPSIDSASAESKRIKEAIEAVYFKETGIRNVPTRSNPNTKYYYMWSELTAKTPCVLIEMGESIDPHDAVLLDNTNLIANALLYSIQNAFPDLKQGTPTVPQTTDACQSFKNEITRLNDIIGKVKDPQIEELKKKVEDTSKQCALDIKTINDQKDSLSLQLIECQKQSDIYKVEYNNANSSTGYKAQIKLLEDNKIATAKEITDLNTKLTKATNQLTNLRKSGLKFIQYAVIKLCEKFEIDLT